MYTHKKGLRALTLAVLVMALLSCTVACSKQEAVPTEPTYEMLQEQITEPTLAPIQIQMPEYELTYSGEFQDVIGVEEVENTLVFTVKLSQMETEIFTLCYNTDEGDFVTVLEDGAGNRIPVAFQMNPMPEDLSDEDGQLFCSAQEAVNEIVDSLVLK